MSDEPPKKPLNLALAPRLRKFLEAFIKLNGRKSAVSVVEEALREFFEKRGIKVDADPEELLREILKDESSKPPTQNRKRGKHSEK